MSYVLQTFNLSKRYKNQWALKDVNMHVCKGDIYGFVGENGSGKTTIIRLVTGLIFATEGRVELFGVRDDNPEILAQRKKVGAIVEHPSRPHPERQGCCPTNRPTRPRCREQVQGFRCHTSP